MSQNNAIASLARLFCAGAEQRSMVVNAVIAILSMLVYVLETLRPRYEISESGCEPEYGSYGAYVFFGITGVILTADYIAVATKKGWQVSFLLSPLALCDFACSLPVGILSLLILLTKNEVLDSCDACCGTRRMHAVHILVVLRLFKLLRVSTMISGESARNVMSFGVQLSSLVMVFTAMIASLEDISFPEGLYFSVVSITTVGFGDVSILRTISRLTVISLVLTTMIMIPMQSHSLFNNQRSGNKDPQARQQTQRQEEEENQNEETAPLQENELNARGNNSATGDGADVQQGPSSSLARRNRQSNHVIICGTITNGLFQFFEEFFHPDHGGSLKPKVLLISDDLQAKLALRMVSSSLERAHFLRLMSGAAYSTPVLNRASMTSARRVYILGNSETGAADADDRQTVLITCTAFATLKAYIRNVEMLEDEDTSAQQSQLRLVDQSFPSRRKLSRDASSRASGLQTTLFVKILRQRSRRMLEELILRDERASLRDRVKILCVEEMKMQILARACMCPGFSAFISNLCRSTSSKLIDKTRVLLDAAPRSRHSGESDEDLGMNPDVFEEHPSDIAWCQEYVDGAANEIYQVPTGSAFSGLTFAEMSIILFEEAGILVLGLSMRSSSDLDARILLNPSDFVIPADPSKIRLQSLVIAPDLAEAGLANVDAQPGKVTGAKPSTTAKSFRFGLGRSSRKPHTILLARSNVPESRTSGLRFTSALSTRKIPAPTSTRISRRMFGTARVMVRQKYATKNSPAANGSQSAMFESGNFSVISLRIRLRAKRAVEASRPQQLCSNDGGLGILSPGLNVGTPKAYGASHTLPSSPKAGRNTQPRLALDRDADTENPAEAVPEDTTEDPQDRYEASFSSDASEHSPAQACLFGDRGGLPANEYHLAPREFCQEDVLVYKSALSEVPGLRKHVIVYGDGADCSELVLQLRGRKTGLAAPIIILSRGPIGHRSWNRINQFAQVYLVRGPPELTSTWRRAGIRRAARVILAAAPSTSSCTPGDPRRRANTDARAMRGADEETLLLYNLVLKENRRVRVSCVLRHNVNVQYMQRRLSTTEVLPNLNDDEELLLSSAIASGTVLCDELFDTIMAQTNYNPHLLKLLSALLKGSRNGVQKATNSEAHASQFYHLGVTPEMARLSYGEVFRILASRAILPVYLHRGVERDTRRGHLGNPEPYVVTSPIGATRLFVVDSLICLALQNPLRGEAIPELGIEPEDTAELDGFAYDLEPVSSGSFSTVATTETTEMSGPVRGVDRAAVEAGQQDTEDAIQEHKRAAKRAKLLRQRDELEACKASLRQQIQDVREYLALVRASVQM